MAESTDPLTGLRSIGPDDVAALTRFVSELPDGDRTFFKEGDDPETVAFWCRDERSGRWIVEAPDGRIRGYLAVIPGVGWSSHVGELRVVVAGDARRMGIGRALAHRGLLESVRRGLDKIVVEVVADKEGDIAMFTSIGFDAEALLKNHIRDRHGETRDLLILAHDVGEVRDSLHALGIDQETGVDLSGGR
jgi:ribosomal protein S18 acetylase RimI-like enzyme